MGFPCGSAGKESACNAEDLGSVPGLGRSPGGGDGNLLQYTCLENPMGREAWLAAVHGVGELATPKHACVCVPARACTHTHMLAKSHG